MERIEEIVAMTGPVTTEKEVAAAAGVDRVSRSGFTFIMKDGRSETTHQQWSVKWPIRPMTDEQARLAVYGLLRAGHWVCVNGVWLVPSDLESLAEQGDDLWGITQSKPLMQ